MIDHGSAAATSDIGVCHGYILSKDFDCVLFDPLWCLQTSISSLASQLAEVKTIHILSALKGFAEFDSRVPKQMVAEAMYHRLRAVQCLFRSHQ